MTRTKKKIDTSKMCGLDLTRYRRRNKGAIKAGRNRTERAVRKALRAGHDPRTDRKLADMMDRLYGMSYIAKYHQ